MSAELSCVPEFICDTIYQHVASCRYSQKPSTCIDPVEADSFGTTVTIISFLCHIGFSFQFRCDNNLCISDTLTCNGIDNCGDRSDEDNCFCEFVGSVCSLQCCSGLELASFPGLPCNMCVT